MKIIKRIVSYCFSAVPSRQCFFLFFIVFSGASSAMVELKDEQLADVTGQALLQMGKTDGQGVSSDITFYKAGLDAEVELNLNIEKLQLGCGGVNGPGCDIDIDNLSLTGQNWSDGRPSSSAILTRPFFEFAVKNDSSKTLREVTGIRLSAENALGLLTAGENSPQPNGINDLSGFMETTNISGTAYTQATNIGGTSDPNNTVLQFDTDPNIILCTSGCFRGNTATSNPSTSDGIDIPSLEVPFTGPGAVVNGNRLTSTSVTATGAVPTVSLDGGQLDVSLESTIRVLFFISVSEATVNTSGSVSGLNAEIDFPQNLGYIHKINVDSPFSLSFQKEATSWPGSDIRDTAQTGWWMSFADPVELGELNPVQQIDISPTFDQMAAAFKDYFEANPIEIGTQAGLQQLFNGEMDVDVGNLFIPSTLSMSVSDLQLGPEQNVVPNCYGSASFC